MQFDTILGSEYTSVNVPWNILHIISLISRAQFENFADKMWMEEFYLKTGTGIDIAALYRSLNFMHLSGTFSINFQFPGTSSICGGLLRKLNSKTLKILPHSPLVLYVDSQTFLAFRWTALIFYWYTDRKVAQTEVMFLRELAWAREMFRNGYK